MGARGLVGQWSGSDQKPHAISEHNTFVDPAWFCPALVLQRASTAADRVVTSEAPPGSGRRSIDHLRVSRGETPTDRRPSIQSVNALTKKVLDAVWAAPQIDLYFDAATHLPVEMAFNTHPDNNLGENMPVRAKHSDYRAVNGVQVPFHLQRFMNGNLMLDVQLDSATFNSGLAASSFVVAEVFKGIAQ